MFYRSGWLRCVLFKYAVICLCLRFRAGEWLLFEVCRILWLGFSVRVVFDVRCLRIYVYIILLYTYAHTIIILYIILYSYSSIPPILLSPSLPLSFPHPPLFLSHSHPLFFLLIPFFCSLIFLSVPIIYPSSIFLSSVLDALIPHSFYTCRYLDILTYTQSFISGILILASSLLLFNPIFLFLSYTLLLLSSIYHSHHLLLFRPSSNTLPIIFRSIIIHSPSLPPILLMFQSSLPSISYLLFLCPFGLF